MFSIHDKQYDCDYKWFTTEEKAREWLDEFYKSHPRKDIVKPENIEIIEKEQKTTNIPETLHYVYLVRREIPGYEFIYENIKDARTCWIRLIMDLPEEADHISMKKLVIRTDYL